jgi:DNA-binding protein H-NS
MSNLIDIQSQIEKLQKQAAEIRSREYETTIKDIRSKMQAFGITLNDLRSNKRRPSGVKKSKTTGSLPRVAKGAKKQSTTKVAPKFRGPDGETWSGRGLTPRWLSTLVAQGRAKDEFAI